MEKWDETEQNTDQKNPPTKKREKEGGEKRRKEWESEMNARPGSVYFIMPSARL